MKKFNITVNGKTYEVEVEEIGGSAAPAQRPAAPAAASVPAPQAAPAPAPKAAPAPVAAGAEVITAPMPGKIMSIKVKVGQAVKEGDLVLTLEAMKMENEIFSGATGSVKEIRVSEGAAVNPGDVLVVIG
ncbi:MAG: biotin/lipoyl-containing protein [Bacillota bacterium]|uniref:Biotin/lipoyl-binding protein n=1 Tax=Thermanaerosceptrum fracticalcis TaxID=1712410 RepID=A0A7G6E779_THEFR|nr:biotin/lipoyl-containing protein [Thermanaerosceptrum fracticalcis]QNB45167.1 biotin/lipoyl-binding protein [Thermanaerosceptrum fracticalcis]QNB45969.1 biotin/lipoyl-binding protein [Thermanaerosceptrum fracticalcis]QNB47933.1 biotin/lipoyl-binding protein [Thermanaerosceptrum fracticalcis]